MKTNTQQNWVVKQLKEKGVVSRNEALQMYITRLGAIICDLKKVGWEFDAYFVKEKGGKNYYYKVTKCPLKRMQYTLADGRTIIKWE